MLRWQRTIRRALREEKCHLREAKWGCGRLMMIHDRGDAWVMAPANRTNAVRYYSYIQKRQAHTHAHDCERKQRQFVIVDLTLALLLDGMLLLLRLQAFLLWWNLIWIYGFRSIDAKWLFRLPLTFCNVWNENYYAIVNHPVGAYCLDNNAAWWLHSIDEGHRHDVIKAYRIPSTNSRLLN